MDMDLGGWGGTATQKKQICHFDMKYDCYPEMHHFQNNVKMTNFHVTLTEECGDALFS